MAALTLTAEGVPADQLSMGRSVIGLCVLVGGGIGSYVPVVVWGAGDFSLSSLLAGGLGAVAGVWLGARIADA